MFKLLDNRFYSPEGTGGSGGLSEEMSKDDIITFLGEEEEPETIPLTEEKPPKKEAKEVKEEKEVKEPKEGEEEEVVEGEEEEEEIDELAEIEEELEGVSDEELEFTAPVSRREIIKKFPIWKEIVKEFPYIEKAYYRERAFTEKFPTLEDADKALNKSKTLDKFEHELMSGSTENVLKAVHGENKEAFYKIVDGYLDTLANVDEKAYNHVLGNVIKHTIAHMVNEARRSKNEKLQEAAHILNQFVFASSEYEPPTRLSRERPEERGKEEELSKQEKQFRTQQFETTRTDLNDRVGNIIKATIAANIDPKKSMSDYVRKAAGEDARKTLVDLINRDTRFKSLMDRLWEKVFESNFEREHVDRIRRAYISKAKTLLPSVIKKARNEALKGSGRKVKEVEEQEEEKVPSSQRKGSERSHESAPKNFGKIKSAKDIPAGMSTLDVLNMD